jgi:hypothetical protein
MMILALHGEANEHATTLAEEAMLGADPGRCLPPSIPEAAEKFFV